jgi:hypothetical protein
MDKLTNQEITEVEKTLGLPLPGLYRKLLIEIGFGRYGQRSDCKSNTTKELYHPEAVRGLYAPLFNDPSALFHPYFPFGCNNHTQELWVIDSAAERAASIWHEAVADDWPEEEWLGYDKWVARFLDDEAVS